MKAFKELAWLVSLIASGFLVGVFIEKGQATLAFVTLALALLSIAAHAAAIAWKETA